MGDQDRWERHVELKAALAGDLDWPAEALPAPTRPEHCGHVLSACGCPNPPDPEQAYEAVRSMLTEALDRAHRAEDANDALRSELATAELRGYERAIEERFMQVGWMGPYGIIPGGMDNDPWPTWKPIYMERPAVASSLVKGDSDGA